MSEPTQQLTSTKPYLVRAIHDWILDNALTPHLVVDATYPGTRVPAEHVKDGQIVLNISPGAVHQLTLGNDWIMFAARFGGLSRELAIPSEAVLGIIARENGQGLFFPQPEHPAEAEGPETIGQPAPGAGGSSGKPPARRPGGPSLKVVK
jgi:stringent starvation protein B